MCIECCRSAFWVCFDPDKIMMFAGVFRPEPCDPLALSHWQLFSISYISWEEKPSFHRAFSFPEGRPDEQDKGTTASHPRAADSRDWLIDRGLDSGRGTAAQGPARGTWQRSARRHSRGESVSNRVLHRPADRPRGAGTHERERTARQSRRQPGGAGSGRGGSAAARGEWNDAAAWVSRAGAGAGAASRAAEERDLACATSQSRGDSGTFGRTGIMRGRHGDRCVSLDGILARQVRKGREG